MKALDKPRIYPVMYNLPDSKELVDWLYSKGFELRPFKEEDTEIIFYNDHGSYTEFIHVKWTEMTCTEVWEDDENIVIRYKGRFIHDVEDFKALLYWIDFVKTI